MDCADEPLPDTTGTLPELNSLLAGTLALMTAWAAPCPQARLPAPDLRRVLACKVVSNLFFLQHHPHTPPALRQVMANSHAHWLGLARPAGSANLPAPDTEAAQLH